MSKSVLIATKEKKTCNLLMCVRQDETLFQIWVVYDAASSGKSVWHARNVLQDAPAEKAAYIWDGLLQDRAPEVVSGVLEHLARDFEEYLVSRFDYSPAHQALATYQMSSGNKRVIRAVQPRKGGLWYVFDKYFYLGFRLDGKNRTFEIASSLQDALTTAREIESRNSYKASCRPHLPVSEQLASMEAKVATEPKTLPGTVFIERFRPECFYHFTDTRNIESIRDAGGLLSMREMLKRDIKPVAAGGSETSQASDAANGTDGYVHLCFVDQNPMEYRAKEDGRIQTSAFLEIDASVLNLEGILMVPGFSNQKGIPFLSLDQAVQEMDFEILYQKVDWSNVEQMQRILKARKYELLVPNQIPLSMIRNL